jgi:hypothetical protein
MKGVKSELGHDQYGDSSFRGAAGMTKPGT